MRTSRPFRRIGVALAAASVGACFLDEGRDPQIATASFAPVAAGDALQPTEVDAIVQAAAESVDTPLLAIAVLDRIGNVLRVWNRVPGATSFDFAVATDPNPAVAQLARLNRGAVGIARAAAFLSHSQAPLTSRTGQFISTFHFPATFDTGRVDPVFVDGTVPVRPTIGVRNTSQGPLWQIDASNRGARLESLHGGLRPPTQYDAGADVPPAILPNGEPSLEGLTALPGGFPLYKNVAAPVFPDPNAEQRVARRLVGAIGVYAEDASGFPLAEVAEFAALNGIAAASPLTGDAFIPVPLPPSEGAVYLVGVLLPAFEQTERPAGVGPGVYNAALTVAPSATFPADNSPVDNLTATTTVRDAGLPDPDGYLLSPRDSPSAVPFTAAEVQTIIDACAAAARNTHAAIRLPARAPCAMCISVCDIDGVMLGIFRMEDTTMFSLEISYTKARNSVYFSNPAAVDFVGPRAGQHPLAGIVPPGTAITCRTLGFLSQPRFPPTIEDSLVAGPLFAAAVENRSPLRFDQMGFAPATPAEDPSVIPGTQSGIIFFPGSAPLYRDGVLIGGIGVSGDGVEQDDLVTSRGLAAAQRTLGFKLVPPSAIRCDRFAFEGTALPYFKFPQHPDG